MKKIICTLLAVSLVFCGAMAASAEFKFERKISIVVLGELEAVQIQPFVQWLI